MACRIQGEDPLQLNVTLPENDCRKDFTVYHHPHHGHQISVISCDWVETEQTYDCSSGEPGVIWKRPDVKHYIITLSDNLQQNFGDFRYQTLCGDSLNQEWCLWTLPGNETSLQTVRVNTLETTTSSTVTDMDDVLLTVGLLVSGFVILMLVFWILMKKTQTFSQRPSKDEGTKRKSDSREEQGTPFL